MARTRRARPVERRIHHVAGTVEDRFDRAQADLLRHGLLFSRVR